MESVNDIQPWQARMDMHEERFGRSTVAGPLYFAKEEIQELRDLAEHQGKSQDRLIVALKRMVELFSMEYRVPASGTIPHEIHIAVSALNAAQGTNLVYTHERGLRESTANA